MSSVSFDAAVSDLVRFHYAEIRNLQQQLAQCRNASPSSLEEAAGEWVSALEFHHYPEEPSSSLQMGTPGRHGWNQHPSTPREPTPRGFQQCPLSPRQSSPRASQPDGAEHTSDVGEPGWRDDEPDHNDHDGQGAHNLSLMRWRTFAQNILHGGDSLIMVREGWMQKPVGHLTWQATSSTTKKEAILLAGFRERRRRRSGVHARHGTHSTFAALLRLRQSLFVVHPDSLTRRVWMCLNLLVVLYEVVALSMAPFDAIGKKESENLETASAIFWTMDIILTFFTGIYIHGKLEMRLRMIAQQYFCTWFIFDFAVVALHMFGLLVSTSNASTPGTLFKLIRVGRLLRLGRMLSYIQVLLASALSWRAPIVTKVAQSIAALICFVHINACLWYEAGKSSKGWVTEYNSTLGHSVGRKYLVAMHWSLSQLQGSVDITPGWSIRDRLYAVVSLFGSIIFLAILVSTMTDALVTAQEERKVWFKQKQMLEGFFDRHRIKGALRKRAEYYFHLRRSAEHSIGHAERDRQALEMFPPQLKCRLLAESRAPVLEWHPLFCYLQDFHVALFSSVCTEAIFWHAHEPEDDIFTHSTSSMGAYYIAHGEFVFISMLDVFGVLKPLRDHLIVTRDHTSSEARISQINQTETPGDARISNTSIFSRNTLGRLHLPMRLSRLSSDSSLSGAREALRAVMSKRIKTSMMTRLRKGQLVSEVSLWLPWVHAGDVSAVSHGHCFCIRHSELLKILKEHLEPYELFCSYAARFAKTVNQLRSSGVSCHEIELHEGCECH